MGTLTKPAVNVSHGDAGGRYARMRAISRVYERALFVVPRMHLLSARWDLILSRDFSILTEGTGYFVGTNEEGIDKTMKAAIHVQAVWQFSIPIVEWTTPSATPEGQPVPARWDEGI